MNRAGTVINNVHKYQLHAKNYERPKVESIYGKRLNQAVEYV